MLFRKNPAGTLHNAKTRESSFARYHRARDLSPPKKKVEGKKKKENTRSARDKMGRSNVVCDAKYLIESFISCVRNYFPAARPSYGYSTFRRRDDYILVHFLDF